jgi:DNA-binding GntR family transcriptional regulator
MFTRSHNVALYRDYIAFSFVIDPSSDRAVYRQLADLLREQIASGELGPGAAVPSELTLMQIHGLSRTTVRRSIAELRSEGLVVVSHARTTRVRSSDAEEYVSLDSGTIRARMPSPKERRALDVGDGVPLLIVERNGKVEIYPADRVALRVAPKKGR